MRDFLVYTYCLSKNPIPRLRLRGIDNKKVYQILYKDLGAIVSKVKRAQFNKKALVRNLKKPKWAEKAIRTHAKVAQKVVEKQTVLPLKFGTIFKNDQGVEKMLRANQMRFLRLLNKFKDKEEWGVKVYADHKKLAQVLEGEDREIKKLRQEVTTAPPGRSYLLEKKYKDKLKEKTSKMINKAANKIFQSLRKVSENTRLNKNLPPSLSGKDKEMVLNSVYLISKANFNKFRKLLNSLLKKYHKFSLEGELSGPWPVYSFL